MTTNPRGLLLFSMLSAALCPLAISKQSTQQSQPPVMQLGLRQRMLNPVPIPPDARPPDQLLQGAPVSGTITALAFSPDGKWLAWGAYDDKIVIWHSTTGAEERNLTWPRPANTPVTQLTFTPDGTRLFALASGKIRSWDLQAGKVSSLELQARVLAFVVSPDGKLWAATTFGQHEDSIATIQVGDAATGKILRTIPTKWLGVTGLAITRDGVLVAAGTSQELGHEPNPPGTVQFWDLASGNLLKSSQEFPVIGQLSPDGRLMVADAPSDQPNAAAQYQIVITDLSTNQTRLTLPQPGPSAFFFSPDSQQLAVTNFSDKRFSLWSLATGASVASVPGERDPNEPGGLTTVAFSPDGKRLAAAPYPTFSAKIWDISASRELLEFAGQFSFQALAMSPDGKWLVSASPGVVVQDPTTGRVIKTLSLEDADMLLFSADGRWLAANPGAFPGGMGRSLEVWDTKTWALVANVTPVRDPRRNAPVTSFAFGSPSAQAKLGGAQSIQFTVNGQSHAVWFSDSPIAVSPDGRLLLQLGYPLSNVEVWDTTSGQRTEAFQAHRVGVEYLAFSSDGRFLLTMGQNSMPTWVNTSFQGSHEYGVKLWDVATWKETMSISVPNVRPSSALLSPDRHTLAIERSRQRVDLVNATDGTSIGSFAATVSGTDAGWTRGKPNLAFSPDGAFLFQGAKGAIRVWKLPTR